MSYDVTPVGLPKPMMGLDGKPVPVKMIPLILALQRAIHQQHPGTRTRPTSGGYYGMTGAERNAMKMMQAQQRFAINNPQLTDENYYDESGRHFPVMGPDRVLR